ncbi:uncharacterized protein FYW61_018930 [Anableps anableps]
MIFLQLIACLLLILQVSAFDVMVGTGADADLQCQAPSATAVIVVEWTKDNLPANEYVFFYRNDRSYEKYQHASFRGRVVLKNQTGVKSGDVSVILKNVSLEDMGTYRCRVLLNGAGTKVVEHLQVTQLRNGMRSGNVEELTEDDRGNVKRVITDGESDLNIPVIVGVLMVCVIIAVGGVGVYVSRRKKSSRRQQLDQAEVV